MTNVSNLNEYRRQKEGSAEFHHGESVGFHESHLPRYDLIRKLTNEALDHAKESKDIDPTHDVDQNRIEFGTSVLKATELANQELPPTTPELYVATLGEYLVRLRQAEIAESAQAA